MDITAITTEAMAVDLMVATTMEEASMVAMVEDPATTMEVVVAAMAMEVEACKGIGRAHV